MSIKQMDMVWGLVLSPSHQQILLALADHADDEGAHCFPSIEYLAWKTNYSRRQVQRVIHLLEAQGLVCPVAYVTGGRGHAVEYQLQLAKGVKKSPFKREKDDISNKERVTSVPIKGDIAMSPQPSVEPSEEEPSTEDFAEAQPSVRDVVQKLETIRGYPSPNHGREGRAAKALLKQYSIDDIIGCFQWMRTNPFWANQELFLNSVEAQIAKWLNLNRPTQFRNGSSMAALNVPSRGATRPPMRTRAEWDAIKEF